jgi:hypothetical protein
VLHTPLSVEGKRDPPPWTDRPKWKWCHRWNSGRGSPALSFHVVLGCLPVRQFPHPPFSAPSLVLPPWADVGAAERKPKAPQAASHSASMGERVHHAAYAVHWISGSGAAQRCAVNQGEQTPVSKIERPAQFSDILARCSSLGLLSLTLHENTSRAGIGGVSRKGLYSPRHAFSSAIHSTLDPIIKNWFLVTQCFLTPVRLACSTNGACFGPQV